MSAPDLTPNLTAGDRVSLKRNAPATGGITPKRLSQTARAVGNVQLNIMTDPRVWRGPTHNICQKPAQNERGRLRKDTVTGFRIPKPGEARTRTASSNGRAINSKDYTGARGDYECATRTLNIVLEEITDRPIQAGGSSPGDLIGEYKSPPFVAATTFVDTATTIYHNDLLVFDREVKSLLEVLVGQSLEQALLEVSQEEDELQRKEERRMYQEYRNAQLAEVQRLDARKTRYDLEKKRRIQEKELAVRRAKKEHEEQEMALYAKQYIAFLLPEVYCRMKEEGYFDNQVRQELADRFVPWIGESVGQALDDHLAVDLVMQIMVRKILHENQKALVNDWHDFFNPPVPPTTPIKLRPSQYHIKVIPRIVVSPPAAEEVPEHGMVAPSEVEPQIPEVEVAEDNAKNDAGPESEHESTDEDADDDLPSLVVPPIRVQGPNQDPSRSAAKPEVDPK